VVQIAWPDLMGFAVDGTPLHRVGFVGKLDGPNAKLLD